MKIPRIMDARTSIVLSVSAVAAAVFIAIFGPVVAYVLGALAFVGGCYAAGLTWAPEFFTEQPTEIKRP